MGFYRSKNSKSTGPVRKNEPVKLPERLNPKGFKVYWHGDRGSPSVFVVAKGERIAELDQRTGAESWVLDPDLSLASEGVGLIRTALLVLQGNEPKEASSKALPACFTRYDRELPARMKP